MNPARWAGLGKWLGLWPGDGDGLMYNDEPRGSGNYSLESKIKYHWARVQRLVNRTLEASLCPAASKP